MTLSKENYWWCCKEIILVFGIIRSSESLDRQNVFSLSVIWNITGANVAIVATLPTYSIGICSFQHSRIQQRVINPFALGWR